ncbi:MAG: site-2 protease family protein, partial [Acidimicrobiales bacterium]
PPGRVRQSIRIGRFAGVDVGVNWSVLAIFALLTWELAKYVFPSSTAGTSAADWVAAVAASLAFFASLLAHEVSHAVVARHNDVGVRSITLWLFGGVAQLEGEAHAPGADFRIAAAGPATSIVLAGTFGAAEVVCNHAGITGLPVVVLAWLWKINLLLAAFNLLPAAPLDGGRILRAGLWRHWHDRSRAAVAAARAGRGLAVVLIGLGMLEFAYGGVDGLWPALIGMFLYTAAGAEERAARVRGTLGGLRVGDVMTPHPPAVPASVTVDELVHRYLGHFHGDAIAVTDANGLLAGVLTAERVRAVSPAEQHTVVLSQIARPLAQVTVARPEEPLDVVLQRAGADGGLPLLVLDPSNRLAGIVSEGDVARASAWAHPRPAAGV